MITIMLALAALIGGIALGATKYVRNYLSTVRKAAKAAKAGVDEQREYPKSAFPR